MGSESIDSNDHLGTPQKMTDRLGFVVWRAIYDPFGKTTVNEDVDGDGVKVTLNVRFPGQYYDVESGLHYNYFRTYDPELGRYLTSDPIGLLGGLNTFGYVGGNPVGFTDKYGLDRVYDIQQKLKHGILTELERRGLTEELDGLKRDRLHICGSGAKCEGDNVLKKLFREFTPHQSSPDSKGLHGAFGTRAGLIVDGNSAKRASACE